MRRLAGPMALGVGLALGCGPTGPTPAPPAPTFDLLAWEYPGARPIARLDPDLAATEKVGTEEIAGEPRESGRIHAPALYAYDTPDALGSVYAFYARKLGLDPEFAPHALRFQDEGLGRDTASDYARRDAHPTLRAAYTGVEGRQDVRTATLVGPGGPGFSAVVVLSRGRTEEHTTVELVVTAAPAR